MAKVTWKYPIEELHGALKKGVMGAAQRKAKNNKGERDAFTVMYGKRTTAPTALELQNRANFGAINKLMAQHRASIQQRQTDQAGFRAQTEYKTFNAYLYNVCKQEYEASLTE